MTRAIGCGRRLDKASTRGASSFADTTPKKAHVSMSDSVGEEASQSGRGKCYVVIDRLLATLI